MMKFWQILSMAGLSVLAAGLLSGCGAEAPAGGGATGAGAGSAAGGALTGSLNVDGSGTVFPIGAAVAELLKADNPGVRITVGKSGTGAGMDKFARGETDITAASRPIKPEEIERLTAAGIEFLEVPVAYDGICIVVHPSNTWLTSITLEQLNKIWNKDSTVKLWSDVDPSWPSEPIKLYGPTDAHGTYEFFNEVVNGDSDNVRADFSQQAEYDTLITGVANERNALAYVGFAYVEQNMNKLRVVPVDAGAGPKTPTAETILDGTYAPFSRPLFMYASKQAFDTNPVARAFIELLMGEQGPEAVRAAGYVPLATETMALVLERVNAGRTGSVFSGADATKSVKQILSEAN